jgi:hypothetical protein
MIPEHLKAEYWRDVLEALKRKHHLSQKDAEDALERFQQEGLPKTGDMVFHAEPESTANAVRASFVTTAVRSA